ncbi:MAG: Gfo/Idh/MocA family oxidoreductase [Calditrichia bacterium]
MIKVGVIGVGYWGPNLIRNFYANEHTHLKSVCDLKTSRLDFISRQYPALETSTDYRQIARDPEIDLVVICTPVSTHFEIAKMALENGKHVLIEKPMTATSEEAEELLNLAEKKGRFVFVDHTFLFTGVVKKIKELINAGELGELFYFDSMRINLGLFQHDVNVIWDLAPHDISIMHYLLDSQPEAVVATGAPHFSDLEDVAYLTVYYPGKLLGHINVSWLSPVKVRQTLLAGNKKMIVWDDNQPSEKLRIYDKGVDFIKDENDVYKMLVQYRTGDMHCPRVDNTEALTTEVQHIVDCLLNGATPISDGKSGWMVVKILEAANQSIKNRGMEVRL